MSGRLQRRLFGAAAVVVLLGWLHPVNAAWSRLALICGAVTLVALSVLRIPKKPVCWSVIGITAGLLLWVLLGPAREVPSDELKASYLKNLKKYEGVRYVWGGEGIFGVDCSGLPRRALRDAYWSVGMSHLDASLLRSAIVQWWFDSSAQAMSEGYRDYCVGSGVVGTLREVPVESLVAGDVAITTSGVHMLAYLGDYKWIQADPDVGEVIVVDSRSTKNLWLDTEVAIFRLAEFVGDVAAASISNL